MRPRLHFLITLLLLLAMPLKGIAALGLAGCGASHLLQQVLPCHEALADAGSAAAAPAGDGCTHCAACLAPLWGAPVSAALPHQALVNVWSASSGVILSEYHAAVPQPPPRP